MQKWSLRYSYESENGSSSTAWQLDRSIKGKKREHWIVACFQWWMRKVSLRVNPVDLTLPFPSYGQWPWGILHPGFSSQITYMNSQWSGGCWWVQSSACVLDWVEQSAFPKFLVGSGLKRGAATDFRCLTEGPFVRSKRVSYAEQLKCSTSWWPISGIAMPVLLGNQSHILAAEDCGHLPWEAPALCRGVITLPLLRVFFLIKMPHITKIHLTF